MDDLKPGDNLARGICKDGDYAFDDLRVVSSESVPVVSLEDTESTSCLNYH